jgi:lipopolysaccharide/colanic/teichoic acid biosynthesis glycosyltransferase
LPQLVNVLFGDMSIIGPRPDVPAQRAEYSEQQWRERHMVRPGITGLAQATLRSDATPAQRLELDLRYVRERSLWLDIKIVFDTMRQLFRSGSF